MGIYKEAIISIKNAQNLVVIKTLKGVANAISSFVDKLSLKNVLGTTFGDETVLIVTPTNSDANEVVQKQSTDTVIVNKNKDSIITKDFYKTDKYTGELRVSKTNSISIAVFILMFLFGIFSGVDVSVPVVVVAAIIFGLLFAVPTFIIGNLLGWAIDRLTH